MNIGDCFMNIGDCFGYRHLKNYSVIITKFTENHVFCCYIKLPTETKMPSGERIIPKYIFESEYAFDQKLTDEQTIKNIIQ